MDTSLITPEMRARAMLPETSDGFAIKTVRKLSLNAVVAQAFDIVYDSTPDFRTYLTALDNSDAATGNARMDDAWATKIMIDFAVENMVNYGWMSIITEAKAAKVKAAIVLVLKDRQMTRKQRIAGLLPTELAAETPAGTVV